METTVSLESIWAFLQSLTLTDSGKDWLAEKLIESKSKAPKPYTIGELEERLQVAEEDFATGNVCSTEEVLADLQKYIK